MKLTTTFICHQYNLYQKGLGIQVKELKFEIVWLFKLIKLLMEKLNIKPQTSYPFGFPYQPYDVQIQLMEKIYDLLK